MKGKLAKSFDKQWLFFAPLLVVLLGADQASKAWANSQLELAKTVDFGFALSYNDGIIWGIDLPMWLIFLLTIFILGFGTYLVYENKLWQDKWHLTGLALLLAGAIGNLIDRVRFGYVIDFIKIYWWPTFNLADSFIVCSLLLFTWEFLIREHWGEKL